MLDPVHFEKSLLACTTDFIAIYNRTPSLRTDPQYFILYNLLSLIAAGNVEDVTYTVFLQQLWDALVTKQLDLINGAKRLQQLLPSCRVMGPLLSCEAFYWRTAEDKEDKTAKEDIFLCRGKRCYDPAVLPNPESDTAPVTLYDWLHHWGIDYTKAGKPSSRDFPIKLAGYFNRLREIYPRLHCRSCNTVMVPNMGYARTFYKELRNGVVTVQPLAAAYRTTVFHCNNPACGEYDIDHYINHCRGLKCRKIIDSRDLKKRCGQGRYVCDTCGSCCELHERENPADKRAVGRTNQSLDQTSQGHPATLSSFDAVFRLQGRNIATTPTLDDLINVAWPND